ncbi:MAG: ABC transporter permease [Acidobacteriaceae bacterium]|nr:ABC transporter permease [Acidobacteriaceae bacterium]
MSWRRFLRRDWWDRERANEIESYLEIETAGNIARGMTAAEAASAARRKFGNPSLIREEIYRMNTVFWLESLLQDVRYGARLLLANPGFALVAILSLALGIGANTAIFQLLDAVRLRSLPLRNPQELAEVKIVGGNGGMGVNGPYGELTRPIWEELHRSHPGFSGVFAWSKDQAVVGEGSDFQLANAIIVSGDFFRVLGVSPWRGRLTGPDDEHACPETTAVVSEAYWQSKLGGRPINAGTKLLINGELKQIVGVTPPSFFGLVVGERFDIALPFCRPQQQLSRNLFDVTVMGRLQPGWSLQRASARLAAISPGIMAATETTGYDPGTIKRYRNFLLGALPASSGVSHLRDAYDSSLRLLLGITGLVLLIACANLANLMLARAGTREREIAVRLALGAGRIRLLRQLLVESCLLAAIGAALGFGLAELLSRVLISSLSTENNLVTLPVAADARVLLFTACVAVFTCIVFGVVPALCASGADPVTAMKAGGRSTAAGRERFSFQRAIVVMQVSISLVLLVGALLFVRSFYNLMTVDSGLRKDGITVAYIGFQKSNVPREHLEEFKRELLEDVRSVPGILDAATTTMVPLLGGSWSHRITVGPLVGDSKFTWVSPDYFQTMGVPLLAGRAFNQKDTGTSQRVAIVNQTFVRQFLKGTNPLGRTMRTHAEPNYPSTVYEIVGVIPDTKYDCLRCDTPPMAFAPALQFPAPVPWTEIIIHSNEPSAVVIDSIKHRIAAKHPEIIAEFRVFGTQIRDELVPERLMAMLSGFFGVLAALLGMVGLYGVISYTVARRRSEIGIRVALGANRGQVVAMVMREAGVLLVIGVAIGTMLSLAAGRGANSLLFELKSYDPLTLAAAAGLLFVIGALAGFLPARRASKLDPMDALRCE